VSAPLLALAGLRFSYGPRRILDGIDLELAPGELVGIVGANGAGKSTLLRIAAGLLAPDGGSVALGGDPVARLARREVARRIAFLPSGLRSDFGFTVEEVVAMGRTAHVGRFAPLTGADREAIEGALRDAEVEGLRGRTITTLSDGERQRALLARAFAQRAPVLALDEPTANLDLRHAWALMERIRARVDAGAAALAAMHDLGLAAGACDRILVLHEGRARALAPPREALAPEVLADALGLRTRLVEGEGERPTVVVLGRVGG